MFSQSFKHVLAAVASTFLFSATFIAQDRDTLLRTTRPAIAQEQRQRTTNIVTVKSLPDERRSNPLLMQ